MQKRQTKIVTPFFYYSFFLFFLFEINQRKLGTKVCYGRSRVSLLKRSFTTILRDSAISTEARVEQPLHERYYIESFVFRVGESAR